MDFWNGFGLGIYFGFCMVIATAALMASNAKSETEEETEEETMEETAEPGGNPWNIEV